MRRFVETGRISLKALMVALALSGLAFAGGCSGKKVVTKSSPDVEEYRVRTIVVLPFEILATPQVTRPEVDEPVTSPSVLKSDIEMVPGVGAQRRPQPTEAVPARTGMKIAQIFYGKLVEKGGLVVRSPGKAELELARMSFTGEQFTPEEAGRQVAVRLKADAAVAGLVRVYRERVGGKYGADPAVVGFEVKLVAADGRVIWAGSYYESQRPLNEDFSGFLDRGFGFATARELAEYGAEQLADDFPFGG